MGYMSPESRESQKSVITRMAPSPTGPFHIGGMRTLLFNYFYARQHGGKFILRVEDTDKERSKKEYEENLIESIQWLGIHYDEFYRQSDRTETYVRYLEKLIADGYAYISEEEPSEEEKARAEKHSKTLNTTVIRFRNPNTIVSFDDLIRGRVEVDTTDLGDFVIAKDVTHPLYHLGVIIDDYEMGITHVIRAAEHIANTPRQILMIEAIGATKPTYAHVPFILAPDGKRKLSKRYDNVAVLNYRDLGYLPQALMNYLMLVGWNPGTEEEFFSHDDFVKIFSLERVQKAGGAFNLDKLNWYNKHYIQKLSSTEQADALRPYLVELPGFSEERFMKFLPELVDRIHVWSEVKTMIAEGDILYFFSQPSYEAQGLVWKNSTQEQAHKHLTRVYELLTSYSGPYTAEALKEQVWPYAEEVGKGDVLWPLRFALSGREKSPDPFTLLALFGKDESRSRIAHALELLKK